MALLLGAIKSACPRTLVDRLSGAGMVHSHGWGGGGGGGGGGGVMHTPFVVLYFRLGMQG